MLKRKRIFRYPLILVGLLLTTTFSCKKNVNSSKTTSTTVTDVDGNIYHTIVIGKQRWMVENLATTKLNDGTTIANVTDNTAWAALTTAGYCIYGNGNSPSTVGTYGRLYNWYAVNTGKLCPTGWRIPSLVDWNNLQNYLIDNDFNYDSSKTGNRFAKALASASGWQPSAGPGTVGNTDYSGNRNITGFTALPGGYRGAVFINLGFFATWWSSTEDNVPTAWYFYMDYQDYSLFGINANKTNGFSVRCLTDN